MKLTWFGGTTARIHIGGVILVIDAAGAPAQIVASELVSGADCVVENFGAGLEAVDSAQWRPRKAQRPLDDEATEPAVACWQAGPGALLVEAPGEPVLLLIKGAVPELGRWADGAVVVLFGDGEALSGAGQAVLAGRGPRLLALAGDEAALDQAIGALRDVLDGAALLALEAGLAVEI